MGTTSRAVVGLAAFAGLLIGCGDDRDGDPAAMEKTMRGLAAAENAGDPSAAAALMTDAGIAGFYEGASRADLEAGNYEAFGEDPPTIQKLTVDPDALTPIEALLLVAELKQLAAGSGKM